MPFGRAAAARARRVVRAAAAGCVLVPAQWRRRGDAEAVFLNARGGRLSRQAAWAVVQALRAAGRARAPSCRRTCCATRAPPTCSTTAPTCASCRRCSATPRSRRRRCTRRSARSGCGRCTAPPTRGPRRVVSGCRHLARRFVTSLSPAAAGAGRRGVGRALAARRRGRAVARGWRTPTGATPSHVARRFVGRAAGRRRGPRWPARCSTTSARSRPGSGTFGRVVGHGRRAAHRPLPRATTTTRRSAPGWPRRPAPTRSPWR